MSAPQPAPAKASTSTSTSTSTAAASTTAAQASLRERELWSSFVPRLYGVAVGSVLFSFVVALVAALLASPPPPPWIVRSAARQLETSLDNPSTRAAAVADFAEAVGHDVVVFDHDDVVAQSEGADVSAARAARATRAASGPIQPPMPFDPTSPLDPALRARDAGAVDPGRLLQGPADPALRARDPGADAFFNDDGRRKQRRLPFLPQGDSYFVTRLMTAHGASFDVVFGRRGDERGFFLFVGGILAALAVLSVAFARLLATPLRELTRAVDAFGRGDVDVLVDEQKVGPYAPLARIWNAMTARIAAARRSERELLASVSHELRTPLARVRVAVELASEGIDNPDAVKMALADVDLDLAELETMIDDVLTAARLESQGVAAREALRDEVVDVAALVDTASDRFRARHPKHPLHIKASAAAGVHLRGDALLLRRALTNILDNAGKYSEPGGAVSVSVDVDIDHVDLVVKDDGIGVAVADQARLFEPFFRAEKSRTRAAGGVGLGLVIVKRIVEAHGGGVQFVSAPSMGTTVTLRLPRSHA